MLGDEVGIAFPQRLDHARAERGADGVAQVADVRMLNRVEQSVECGGCADVARGDGGLHAHEAARVIGEFSEERRAVVELIVPVAKLMRRCGARVVVVTLKQLAEQLGVGGVDAAISPYGFDLVVAMARVGWVELGHP